MDGYVYILQSKSGRYYIGSTSDIERRLAQHKSGQTQTTRNMGDFKVVLIQQYETLSQARMIERGVKRMERRDYIDKIVRDGFIKINK